MTQDALTHFTMECCQNNLQIGFDAIGDAAIETVLQALEAAAKHYDVRSMRHRIEHAELITLPDAAGCPPGRHFVHAARL